ncbi:autotransporter domain-containing protein [Rahnella sp. Lac-M11]|uniref:Autotransporter domain-containing protein n=1 Tax=Rahnella contaminans TaxID=2703882 RepID=A0A6M2B8V6_9GAMM|nr:autotransporter domain-containing protein [Rahnella contaminans]NGX88894.1 autotransporter domain-containing protein [Rahnella contaminans]
MAGTKKYATRLTQGAFAVALCLGTQASAQAYDQLYVFGDSLSDTGNIGRWTFDSSSHQLYDEILANNIGTTLKPSSQGGQNYAEGGGVAVPGLDSDYTTQEQVQHYLASTGGKADPNGLYIHWIGGNDLAAAALSLNPVTALQIATNSATQAASQVNDLLKAGAGTVIVPTVPNIGLTPVLMEGVIQVGLLPVQQQALEAAYQYLNAQNTPDAGARTEAIHKALAAAAAEGSGIPLVQDVIAKGLAAAYDALKDVAGGLTDTYNTTEDIALAKTGGNIARVDINGLFNEVVADPALYGFANTAGTACPVGTSASECTSNLPGFDASKSFLFSDHFHPTPQAHALITQYMQSVINGPLEATALNQGSLALARNTQGLLDSRYQQLRTQDNDAGTFGMFGGYAGQSADSKINPSLGDGDLTSNSLNIGMDYQMTDRWMMGLMISGSDDKQDPTDHYSYRTRGWMATAFTGVKIAENGWINGDVHYGSLNYDDINRRITLGPTTRTERGETDGKQIGGRVTAGWDFPILPVLKTGPVAQYSWDYSSINGYSEQGSTSTSMRFGDQTSHSQIGALGWRVNAELGIVNPYAQVTYDRQFGDKTYTATGAIKSTRTHFSRTTGEQDDDWVDMTVGANVQITHSISAFAAVSQTTGLDSGEQTSYNAGISARF